MLHTADLAPDRTVMLSDTPYDVESAAKTGVGVTAFRTGGLSDEKLSGAIAIYDDPADVLLCCNSMTSLRWRLEQGWF